MFASHDERQGKSKQQKLSKGAAYFQNMCSFDAKELKKALDEEIAGIEAQIATAKAGSKQRQMEKLSELVLQVEDGKILELAAKKHAKFEAEIRNKIKAEVRKEVEAELRKEVEAE